MTLMGFILMIWEGGWECFHNFWRFMPPPLGPARCDNNNKLEGKVAIVTGANSGIGKETVLQLAKRGAKVIMACRDSTKGNAAADDIISKWPPSDLQVEKIDLASLKSVRNFAIRINKSESKIDYLINNAGIMNHPKAESEEGYELHWSTNYLGHFLLTLMLLEKLKASPEGKIVNVSSVEHLFGEIYFEDLNREAYNPFAAYGQSKLALVVFTQELAARLKKSESGLKVYSVHPGLARTDLYKYLTGIFALGNALALVWVKISPFLATQTTLFCLLDPSVENDSGGYYANCKKAPVSPIARGNVELQKKLWDVSCKMAEFKDTTDGPEMVMKMANGNQKKNGKDKDVELEEV